MRPRASALLLSGLLVLGVPYAALAADEEAPKVAGTDVPAPKRTKIVLPEYPAAAQTKGIRGIVILELVIDTDGHVASAEVVRSLPYLDEAALAAVRKWEYEPTKVDGKPVKVRLTVPITFAMKVPEVTRQPGIPELRQGVNPTFPPGVTPKGPVTVTAELTLDSEGRVADAQVLAGEPPYSTALLQAVRTWGFVAPEEGATVSFRAEAQFSPGAKGDKPRVEVHLLGLRRSESVAPASASPPPTPVTGPTPVPAPAPVAPPPSPRPSPEASPAPHAPPPTAVPGATSSPAPVAPPAPSPRPTAPASKAGGPAPAVPSEPPMETIRVATPPPTRSPEAETRPLEPGIASVRDVTLAVGVPDLVKGRRPTVPPLARMAGVSGTVEVHFGVDPAGITSVTKTEGAEQLKTEAEQAVSSWVFRRTSPERLHLVAVFTYKGDIASAAVRPEG